MHQRTRILILSLLTFSLFVASISIFNYVPDDTFITLRYARNVLRGEGFVFNAGEKVEGYTGFLWLLLLIAAGKLGAPLIFTARTLSFIFSLGTLVLAGIAARANLSDEGTLASDERREGWKKALEICFPPMLLAASPPLAAWSLSGTEMPLFTFLLLAGFLFLGAGKRPLRALIVFGLLGLVRPEGALLYAVALGILLVRSPRKVEVGLLGIAVAAILYVPYLGWKWRYYHALLPNTFYAKTGPLGLMLANGAKYLFGFILSYGYLLFAGLFLLRASSRSRERLLAPLLFVAACWLEVLFLGGDWMPHYRLLLPTLPFIMLVVSRGVMTAARGTRAPVFALMLLFLAMVPGAITYDSFLAERVTVRAFAVLGRRLREILPPETRIACGSTGAIGYYTDMPIIDILGLTESRIARQGRIVGTQPGHFKTDGAYVLERKPDILLLGNIQIHLGEREPGQMRLKIQEKEIASRPEFSRDYEFMNLRLGGGFYLSCFKRKAFFLPV